MIDGVTKVIQLEQLLEQGKTAADIRKIINKNIENKEYLKYGG